MAYTKSFFDLKCFFQASYVLVIANFQKFLVFFLNKKKPKDNF
jgi:hypothetical protein